MNVVFIKRILIVCRINKEFFEEYEPGRARFLLFLYKPAETDEICTPGRFGLAPGKENPVRPDL